MLARGLLILQLDVGTSHDFARVLLSAAGQLSWLQEGSTGLQ